MKKMAFPIGKANLTTESMPILAKVNQTIRDLGVDSLIEVQGHTDSSGNRSTNQSLSEKRAEAIKAYLVANGLDEKNIRTIGYGDSKPIAPNKTKAGRAENRRVDIVIEPIIPVS
jgi:outer membrane protein OmpA-like peptidoglycan-associated protein